MEPNNLHAIFDDLPPPPYESHVTDSNPLSSAVITSIQDVISIQDAPDPSATTLPPGTGQDVDQRLVLEFEYYDEGAEIVSVKSSSS